MTPTYANIKTNFIALISHKFSTFDRFTFK